MRFSGGAERKTASRGTETPFRFLTSATPSELLLLLGGWALLLALVFFLRDVFLVHLGFIPVKHERGLWIVGHQRGGEAHWFFLLEFRRIRLTDNLDIPVGTRPRIELGVGGHERALQLHRVRTG